MNFAPASRQIASKGIALTIQAPCKQIEDKRDAVIRCLLSYLGESSEELIEVYQDVSRDMIKDNITNHVMKIIVLGNTAGQHR
ncbi:hypothetical protein F2P79_000214 [Pimephales promelas]|nr:hypothetical protein F2P79_000214 [Pimephales promelas]